MKHIPNLDYRFEDVMHSTIDTCISGRSPAKIAFVCLPKDNILLYKRIASFMSSRKYGVSHYVAGFGGNPVLQFENGSEINIMTHKDEWLGRTFTDMVMFCRLDEMHISVELCLRSCVFSCKPMIFSLLSKHYNQSITLKEIYEMETNKA